MKKTWRYGFLDPGNTKRTKRVMYIVLAFLISFSVQASTKSYPGSKGITIQQKSEKKVNIPQKKTIRGKVTDVKGEPIPGVSVVIKGTGIGAATSLEGTYTLEIPDGYEILEFSFVGMNKQEVTIAGQVVINVELTENTVGIDDVVVIGYQEVRRKNTSASVVSIRSADIENTPSPSFEDAIQGQLAGVNVQSLSGAPGTKGVLLIRGNTNLSSNITGEMNAGGTGFSNPLYVIDGVITSLQDFAGYDATNTNFLSSLNMNDIESIDILKDASAAAIYGSRGANGVVLIKTKKGKTGKPVFRFNAYWGLSSPPNLVPIELGVSERRAKMDLINDYYDYDRIGAETPIMLTDSLNPFFNNNVNYQDLFYQSGMTQNYDFGVSGGTENTNYRLSLAYYNEEGIVTATGFERISANMNFGIKIDDKIENQTTIRLSNSDRQTGLGGTSSQWWGVFPIQPNLLNSSLFYLSDEKKASLVGQYEDIRNVNNNISINLSNNLRTKLMKGLYLNNTLALTYNTSRKDYFSPTHLNTTGETYAESKFGGNKSVTMDNYLSYSVEVAARHNFTALVGTSVEKNVSDQIYVEGSGAPSNNVKTVSGIPMEDIDGYSNYSEYTMLSYWGRFGYRLDDKYILDLNFRTDASSRFGKNTRWGKFPAIGAGWIFSREGFIKDNMPWLTYGKLRGSWGINGSQDGIGNYTRFNTYTSGNGSWGNHGTRPVSSYNGVTVVQPNYGKISNDDLSWVTSKQWSVGLDLELFKRRLYITPEIYNRETEDLLFNVVFPIETGYTNSQANIAGVRNYGWELSVQAYTMKPGKDFQWTISANASHNENQVTALPNGGRDYIDYSGSAPGRTLTVGLPLNNYYLMLNTGQVFSSIDDIPVDPVTGGIMQVQYNGAIKPGTWEMVDVNGDGQINFGGDRMVIPDASPEPKLVGGFQNKITYKRWTASINASFTMGRTIYNQTLAKTLLNIDWNTSIPVLKDINYWKQEGDVADMAGLEPGRNLLLYQREDQSHWLEDGDYLKITRAQISYNVNKEFTQKIGLKELRIYSTAQNIAMFQKSDVPDAEQVNAAGYDIGTGYPNPFKITFGVNIKF